MTIDWLFLLLEVERVARRLSLAATLLVDFSLQLNHTQLTPGRNLVEPAQLLHLRLQPNRVSPEAVVAEHFEAKHIAAAAGVAILARKLRALAQRTVGTSDGLVALDHGQRGSGWTIARTQADQDHRSKKRE